MGYLLLSIFILSQFWVFISVCLLFLFPFFFLSFFLPNLTDKWRIIVPIFSNEARCWHRRVGLFSNQVTFVYFSFPLRVPASPPPLFLHPSIHPSLSFCLSSTCLFFLFFIFYLFPLLYQSLFSSCVFVLSLIFYLFLLHLLLLFILFIFNFLFLHPLLFSQPSIPPFYQSLPFTYFILLLLNLSMYIVPLISSSFSSSFSLLLLLLIFYVCFLCMFLPSVSSSFSSSFSFNLSPLSLYLLFCSLFSMYVLPFYFFILFFLLPYHYLTCSLVIYFSYSFFIRFFFFPLFSFSPLSVQSFFSSFSVGFLPYLNRLFFLSTFF